MPSIPTYISQRNQNHMPFDEGAVCEAFKSVLGGPPLTKTTKTMCGRRVQVSRADYTSTTTCPECQIALTRKWHAMKRLQEAIGQR